MHHETLEELEVALSKIGAELAPRASELAEKSSDGTLTPEERREYEDLVQLNNRLSLAKVEAQVVWARAMRAAS